MNRGLRLLTTLTVIIVTLGSGVSTFARSAADVQAEIDAQNAALAALNNELSTAQANLDSANAVYGGAASELDKLTAQISQLESEIVRNKLQIQILSETHHLKSLQQEDRSLRQESAVRNGYMNWRSVKGNFYTGSVQVRKKYYQSHVIASEQEGIDDLAAEVVKLGADIESLKGEIGDLESQNTKLAEQKALVQQQVLALQNQVYAASTAVLGIQAQAQSLQQGISGLSAEMTMLQEYENWVMQQNQGTGGSGNVNAGQFYFNSRGRDNQQGHQVGMSQWGAYGAAAAGLSAEQILNFYYTDVHIEQRPASVNVYGYGVMDSNVYAAGQAEVPGKACGNSSQVASNPAKYVLDNPGSVWDCWPEAAIKAQIIAFRTYGVYRTMFYGGLCTTAACQVYNGTQYTNWAAEETRDMVLVSHGYSDTNTVIDALYSADNNQGFGTADSSSVFGSGSDRSYLKPVNDNQFVQSYFAYCEDGGGIWIACRDFRRNTLGYTYADVVQMLNESGAGWLTSALGGGIALITFERDVTNHVRRVNFLGVNNSTIGMDSIEFKGRWNSWVFNRGTYDYIFSLTFRICVNNQGQIGCDIAI